MKDPRVIALVGLMGSGKSVVARELGERLDVPHVDLDRWMEREAGASIAELFARQGEDAFRDLETLALGRVLDDAPMVLACGGGVVERAANRELLRGRCRTVWLEVTVHAAAERIRAERDLRPMLQSGDVEMRLTELLARRAPAYGEVAEFRIDTSSKSPCAVADEIVARLGVHA